MRKQTCEDVQLRCHICYSMTKIHGMDGIQFLHKNVCHFRPFYSSNLILLSCRNKSFCFTFREGHDEFHLGDHKPTIFKKGGKHRKYSMEP